MKRILTTLGLTFALAGNAWTAQAADNSRLDDVIKSGKLRICMTGDYKPFTFYKPDQTFEGIDVDLGQSLAASLGVQAQFVKTTWTTLTNAF